MNNQIHGHDVLDLMIASGEAYTRATLTAALDARFGPEARYHTCSAEGMTAAELLDFFVARGKFLGSEAGFTVDTANVCSH